MSGEEAKANMNNAVDDEIKEADKVEKTLIDEKEQNKRKRGQSAAVKSADNINKAEEGDTNGRGTPLKDIPNVAYNLSRRKYEGGSFFHVVIFDTSRLEIEYPEDQRVNSDQPNVTKIKKEDGDDDSFVEIMAEWPSKTREEISVSSLSRLSKGDEEVLQGKGLAASSARDGVLQRARAFRSPNPHFIVIMKPAYDSHLDILESDATSHFHGRNDNEIYLMGPDAVAWPMKYSIGDPPLCQVRIISGWDKFSQTYRLLDGDACIFERLSCTLLAFNITIFRTDEEGEGKRRSCRRRTT